VGLVDKHLHLGERGGRKRGRRESPCSHGFVFGEIRRGLNAKKRVNPQNETTRKRSQRPRGDNAGRTKKRKVVGEAKPRREGRTQSHGKEEVGKCGYHEGVGNTQ